MAGKFLIAVPGLDDPNFRQAVVLLCEHTEHGAFGLIVNKILMNSFIPLINALEIKSSLIDMPVYYGGPVRPEQGYVLYAPFDGRYGSIRVSEHISVTASKEILQDIAGGRGPENFLFTLGFSGWDANQLEKELTTNSWIEVPLDKRIIFDVPVEDRWRHAAGSIGLDLDRYSNSYGSA